MRFLSDVFLLDIFPLHAIKENLTTEFSVIHRDTYTHIYIYTQRVIVLKIGKYVHEVKSTINDEISRKSGYLFTASTFLQVLLIHRVPSLVIEDNEVPQVYKGEKHVHFLLECGNIEMEYW